MKNNEITNKHNEFDKIIQENNELKEKIKVSF